MQIMLFSLILAVSCRSLRTENLESKNKRPVGIVRPLRAADTPADTLSSTSESISGDNAGDFLEMSSIVNDVKSALPANGAEDSEKQKDKELDRAKKILEELSSTYAGEKSTGKDSSALIKKSKDLLKKNNKLIKNIEKDLKKFEKDSKNLKKENSTASLPKKTSMADARPTKAGPAKVSSAESGPASIGPAKAAKEEAPAPATTPTASKPAEKAATETASPVSGKSPASNVPIVVPLSFKINATSPPASPLSNAAEPKNNSGSIKKLSDLFFKSAILTKNEILTKEDSSVLIENSNKIKSIIGQLQRIHDTTSAILNKFLDGKNIGSLSYDGAEEKPKDVLKYKVIEVTENKK